MLLKVFCRYTLIQVLQKAKATFSRKEKEQDGIFQSLIPPCEQQAFSERQKYWYSRAWLTERPAVTEVLTPSAPTSLGFPTWLRDPSKDGAACPQWWQWLPQTAHRSQQNVPALNLMWLHRDKQDAEIASCSYKGKVGERSREFSLFVGPQASPYLLTTSLTQPDPCFIAVIISPQVFNSLAVLNIHSTQSNSTHVRYWEGNSRTFKSF